MIFQLIETFLDGAHMVGLHDQYAWVIQNHSNFVMVASHATLIAIDASYLEIIHSDLNIMHSERTQSC
jgi:hypothetical protein